MRYKESVINLRGHFNSSRLSGWWLALPGCCALLFQYITPATLHDEACTDDPVTLLSCLWEADGMFEY